MEAAILGVDVYSLTHTEVVDLWEPDESLQSCCDTSSVVDLDSVRIKWQEGHQVNGVLLQPLGGPRRYSLAK
jgi:hypothetical protein